MSGEGTPAAEFRARRAAAYQAWYEHLPMRIPPPDGADVRIYRDVAFGDLARIFLLDTRQYSPPPPCRDTAAAALDAGPTCPEREDPDRTLLGSAQEQWLTEGLAGSGAAWNVLAQQVLMAGLDVSGGSGERRYYLDSWDGYPEARARLVDLVAQREVANPVVLTGDYHAAFVSDLRRDPFDDGSPTVATELVTTAISSGLFGADYSAQNPHLRYFEARHGYMTCTVERERLTAAFRYISDVNDPDATVETGATWVIESGTPGAVEA